MKRGTWLLKDGKKVPAVWQNGKAVPVEEKPAAKPAKVHDRAITDEPLEDD